jgi:hypothetical protein
MAKHNPHSLAAHTAPHATAQHHNRVHPASSTIMCYGAKHPKLHALTEFNTFWKGQHDQHLAGPKPVTTHILNTNRTPRTYQAVRNPTPSRPSRPRR